MKKGRRTFVFACALLLLFGGFTAVGAGVAAGEGITLASSVDPVFVPDNPTCADLGYDLGYRIDPPSGGTYTFPGTSKTVTITTDGTYFDWTSGLGIDAVIAKGGPNANVYVYDPPAESFGDTGLHSPINPSTGNPYGLSHIDFCYDFEVDVTKTAETTFTRTYQWTIDKSVTPDTWHLFTGDEGTSKYTVSVVKTGYTDSAWAVSGTITIHNDTPFDATITDVTDVVSTNIGAVVDCGVMYPHELLAGHTLTCSYGPVDLPDGSSRTNTATVTTYGVVGGGEATADVTFGDPTTEVNATIHVEDTNGESFVFAGTASVTYGRTFDCAYGGGTYDNTATIVETGQSDSASVTVDCYALGVTKTADTTYTRYWDWTIDKWADESELVLSPGQVHDVHYSVTVDAASTDDHHMVSGVITVANPHPYRAATLTSVSDLVSPDIAATVVCPSSTVPADGSLDCTYTVDLPDGSTRANTATATLQNYAFDPYGTATPIGTTDFASDPVDVVFGGPTEEIDECIDVSDTYAGFLGTVCADDPLPKTFTYTRQIGPYYEPYDCGDQYVMNTASFVTNDRGRTGEDSWTVHVFVPCEFGCTLTPGYWKTHSEYGPAPYDDTWAMLPGGADTPFFLSGQTYYEVLWTTAAGGNAYYILANAYIAAELNQLNGASIPVDVLAAFDEATMLFGTYTPAQIGALKGNKPPRPTFLALAGILDDYNNGYLGPGHCSE